MSSNSNHRRTIDQINRLLKQGKATVMTAAELSRALRAGTTVGFKDVHVVTAATCGLMSGTYAVLSFPVCPPSRFTRAAKVHLNGVEAYPGPCPNERIGLIDAVVFATRSSRSLPGYGGGHLLQDLCAGKQVIVEVQTDEGHHLQTAVRLSQMPHAVLHGSRHAFRNYVGFVNPSPRPVPTIFCSIPLPPRLTGATACGCGELNPIEKDPGLRTIGVGTRVLVNGAVGYVSGAGTRASAQRPNLSIAADLHAMKPTYMGGFKTSMGIEPIQTWAVPIPILDNAALAAASVLDEHIGLPITDVAGRQVLAMATYADLWPRGRPWPAFDAAACLKNACSSCPPEQLCPMGAFARPPGGIDRRRCFHCGLCAAACPAAAFSATAASVAVGDVRVPVIQRLSDRCRAMAAARDLKHRLLNGRFALTAPVEPIRF
jgi:putative methanogenesis marker 16 metalloprotein